LRRARSGGRCGDASTGPTVRPGAIELSDLAFYVPTIDASAWPSMRRCADAPMQPIPSSQSTG
jgi:hypothetical protein